MYKLELQELADNNLDFIFGYIAIDNKEMAVKIIQSINKSIENLKYFPYMGKQLGSLREFVESNYKFRIIYNINEDKQLITIISIFKNKNTF